MWRTKFGEEFPIIILDIQRSEPLGKASKSKIQRMAIRGNTEPRDPKSTNEEDTPIFGDKNNSK